MLAKARVSAAQHLYYWVALLTVPATSVATEKIDATPVLTRLE